MNNYPLYIEINNKKYPINTDYRIALECDEIARDDNISELEKALAIVYKILGDEIMDDLDKGLVDLQKTINLVVKYLRCGKEDSQLVNDKEPSMDFKQDESYIKASFAYCYPQKDLTKEMHWWEFNDLLVGLTEDCILNRVRSIREEPLTGKKGKELEQLKKAKQQVALKREKTTREKELDKLWEQQLRKE